MPSSADQRKQGSWFTLFFSLVVWFTLVYSTVRRPICVQEFEPYTVVSPTAVAGLLQVKDTIGYLGLHEQLKSRPSADVWCAGRTGRSDS